MNQNIPDTTYNYDSSTINNDNILTNIVSNLLGAGMSDRKRTTVFYGYITFIVTLLFIFILPSWNRLSSNLYYRFIQLNRWLKVDIKTTVLRMNPMSAQMIIFWSVVLSILSLLETNWDLRYIASRLGRVPVYCLPTVLFLTLRPSPLNDVLYLSLLPIHKWLSRLVILQSLLHTLAYIYIFTQNGTMYKIARFDNQNGVIAMVAFTIIFLTSLPSIRRGFYNVFFINHYICTWIVTITLYFHVRPGIPYLTMLNCGILLYQIYYKFKISKVAYISTMKVSSQMLVADMPNDAIAAKFNLPGCHIRLIDYNDNYSKFWNILKMILLPVQHPYTLASLPVDKSQKLIVRIGTYKLQDHPKYLITGAYLPHLSFIQKLSPNASNLGNNPFLRIQNTHNIHNSNNLNSLLVSTQVKKCLIVVGGSAISFALPILRVLNYNGAMVKIIWVIRDHEDLKALDYFKNYLINDDCIDIFITGKYTDAEKENFKDALSELHKRKRELELQQETEILSGGYSYYNTNSDENINKNNEYSEIDMNNAENAEVVSVISSSGSLNLDTDLGNTPHSIQNNISLNHNANESTPLNKHESLPDYGSSVLNTQLDKLHKKSYIDFKIHNQDLSTSYTMETIDIELNDKDRYKRDLRLAAQQQQQKVISTPSAGVGSIQYVNEQDDNLNTESTKLDSLHSTPLAKKSQNRTNYLNNKSSFLHSGATRISPQTSPTRITAFQHNPRKSPTNIPQIPSAFSSPINNKLFSNKAESISTSSALYDDLENYWVLKGSYSKIEFGRPKLGLQYYGWCIGSSCIGPLVNLQSGKAVCYNIRDDPASGYNDQLNELYSNDTFLANREARINDRNGQPDDSIWVIAAGPGGLVDNARLWANDCGFCFHEESFIV